MTGTRKNGWSGAYTVYRKVPVLIAGSTGQDDQVAEALVFCTVQMAGGPKQALAAWFDSLTLDDQVKLDGNAEFIVVPSSNHHVLKPKIEAHPRLVF